MRLTRGFGLVTGLTAATLVVLTGCMAATAIPTATPTPGPTSTLVTTPTPTVTPTSTPLPILFIDTHVHLEGMPGGLEPTQSNLESSASTGIYVMRQAGVTRSILAPPPAPIGESTFEILADIVRSDPARFAFLGGGRSLNPIIQSAVRAGEVDDELRQRFKETAEAIVQAGAVGFGEMNALHLSFVENHPFEVAPPDYTLHLLLSDLAAQHDLPIDLHMEVVTQDMPIPERFDRAPNPAVLTENLVAFERLLAHNRNARIVWAHVGWDNTGHMTVALLRRLLEDHPNLFMQLKLEFSNPAAEARGIPQSIEAHRPLDQNGILRAEWADLINAFPTRFIIGSDVFYGLPQAFTLRVMSNHRGLLDQLQPEIARMVGQTNVEEIYGL